MMNNSIFLIAICYPVMVIAMILIADRIKDKDNKKISKYDYRYLSPKKSIEMIFELIVKTISIVYLLLILSALYAFVDSQCPNIFITMLTNINNIWNLCLGIMTIIISVLAIVTTFSKSYYILFDISDVFRKTKCSYTIPLSIITWLASYLLYFLLSPSLNEKNGFKLITDNSFYYVGLFILLQITFTVFFLCTLYSLFIILRILLGKNYSELNILNNLYTKAWDTNLFSMFLNIKKEKKGIIINVSYLLEKFAIRAKKVPISKIKSITYISLEKDKGNRWYQKASNRLIFIDVITLLIAIVPEVIKKSTDNAEKFAVIIAFVSSLIFIIILKSPKFKNKYYSYITQMVYVNKGYCYDFGGKYKFASIWGPAGGKKLKKFNKSIINIICFIKICLSWEKEDHEILESLTIGIQNFSECYTTENSLEKAFILTPLFILTYYKYSMQIRATKDFLFINKIMKKNKLTMNEKETINKYLFGLLSDVDGSENEMSIKGGDYCGFWKKLQIVL